MFADFECSTTASRMRLVAPGVTGLANRGLVNQETGRRVQLTGAVKFHRLKQIRIGLERNQP